ncbi:carbohydrate deacetylase [Empidonax traillii]|uniref:carbohydrate deacetylase n=1 Tax=Empidonax traillii TaxID=164674 RepID=UPI000FFD6C9F|nr:carbohydrate deacetylase [Empidonax traillii]XP_027762202.1 carbohydrate deacetylase [Empidonax traillii]XP_027762203.1 carbohydrate deacetylase [Empidonax traillii]XP_027762204.1 carbohydrate deacetylase [Empidonax traillii]XP_027762205.1 carbohydrate deacetylase [Empidonax traillii]XP_027762207.1 carbohydrate deacetylase [Empidonax traillii]XP_027762208.1 carbohydrate deacetylase [Empidonax traillii]
MLQVKLIITGDDFGYCPRRNQGIVDCFLAGAISNVSLLVNGSAAADAAKLAKRYSIPIGLHANLSEGSPVCEVLKTNSSLLNQDGFFHGKMGFRTALSRGLLNMSEVKQELKAQVELFRELTGHLPPHMDGHQHVHVLPEVRHVFAEVLEEYGIKYTRVPVEPGLHNCDWIPRALMDFYLGVEEDSFNTVDVFTKHGIRWPDIYIGLSTMGKNMSVSSIWSAINSAILEVTSSVPSPAHSALQSRTVTIELMVHPGYPSVPPIGGCGEGPDDFSQSWERLHELQTLIKPELQSHYKSRNIQLCSFKDL